MSAQKGINHVVLVGRLANDPKISSTAQNNSVASFTLAVAKAFVNPVTGDRDADFIPVVAWRQQADVVKNFLKKGSECGVEGRIQTRSYTGKDGQKRYVTEVLVDSIYLIGGKREDGMQAGSSANFDDDDANYSNNNASVTDIDNDLPF
jgi:single-strand DNA-binding protein